MFRRNALRVAIPAVLLAGMGALVLAQAPQTAPQNADDISDSLFRSSTFNIVAPTLVTDRAGNIIDGLQPHQFHLFDNKKDQNIQVDVSFLPISMNSGHVQFQFVGTGTPYLRNTALLM